MITGRTQIYSPKHRLLGRLQSNIETCGPHEPKPRARPRVPRGLPAPAVKPTSTCAHVRSAENFPVALRALPAEVRQHLHAVYDVTRVIDDLGDEAPGDRTALLAAFARRPGPHLGRRRAAGPGAAPAGGHGARVRPVPAAVRRPRRGQPARPGASTIRHVRRAAGLLRAVGQPGRPAGAAGVRRAPTPGPGGAVRPGLHRAAGHRALPGRRRGPRAPGGSTCRWRTSTGSASRSTDLDAATPSRPLRRLVAFEAERAAELLAAASPLLGELRGWARLAVAGYVAGGRAAVDALRRADCGGAARASAGPPARRPRAELVEPCRPRGRGRGGVNGTVAEAYDVCASDHAGRRPATSSTASACCRPTSAARCAPCTRWPGASTTSATATCRLATKAAALAEVRADLRDIDRSTDPVLVAVADTAPPLPDAAGRVRRAGRRRRDGRHRHARYETFDDLVGYCRCVAGSVGRLCLGVFGSRPDPRGRGVRRRARHRAAADQHPARHPRGPAQRAGLPAQADWTRSA